MVHVVACWIRRSFINLLMALVCLVTIALLRGGESSNLFNNQKVTGDTAADKWKYDPVKFWPTQGHIDFWAYAPYDAGTKFTSTSIVDFTVKDKVADQKDLLWANATNKTNGTVTFNFAHALSRLGYSVKLKDASYESVATITLNKITLAGSTTEPTQNAFYIKGTIDLSTGNWSTASSNDAKQNFEWFDNKTSGDKTLSNNEVIKNPDNEYLFVIPQDFSTGNANADQLYVIVEYTVSYNGGVKATVPYKVSQQLTNNFEKGKAYTINLTIGLTPIEFNAAVTDWVDAKNPINDIPVTWN
ncbi:fimbrillin family protein [Prevotella copri]|uniref:Fimbrillin family protein n=1 Tax=Segatella copri TaxID=165179 RepID=A0AA90V3P5_9BACT|nr:fimbrillin family protein [Segatella copri]